MSAPSFTCYVNPDVDVNNYVFYNHNENGSYKNNVVTNSLRSSTDASSAGLGTLTVEKKTIVNQQETIIGGWYFCFNLVENNALNVPSGLLTFVVTTVNCIIPNSITYTSNPELDLTKTNDEIYPAGQYRGIISAPLSTNVYAAPNLSSSFMNLMYIVVDGVNYVQFDFYIDLPPTQ